MSRLPCRASAPAACRQGLVSWVAPRRQRCVRPTETDRQVATCRSRPPAISKLLYLLVASKYVCLVEGPIGVPWTDGGPPDQKPCRYGLRGVCLARMDAVSLPLQILYFSLRRTRQNLRFQSLSNETKPLPIRHGRPAEYQVVYKQTIKLNCIIWPARGGV